MKKKRKITLVFPAVMLLGTGVFLFLAGIRLPVGKNRQMPEDIISVQQEGEIREIGFEEYVCGVTARQLPADMPYEAVKAQMVIARTNLRKFQEEHPGELLSEESCSWEELEESGRWEELKQASQETKGEVLEYENQLVQVPFHAISSGRTRSGKEAGLGKAYDWLTSVESPQDQEAEYYRRVALMQGKEIRKKIRAAYPKLLKKGAVLKQIMIEQRDAQGYVTWLNVGGKRMSGEKFRSLLQLPSSCFYLGKAEGKIRITTQGWGHGLGLSQYGARCLAEQGEDYQKILKKYLEQLVIKKEKTEEF